MSLALNEAQFAMFIQFLKQQSSDTLSIQKAVTRIGKQRDHDVWVMGKSTQINVYGEIIPVECQSHTWLEWSVQQGLGNISLKEVLPTVVVPLSAGVLHQALQLLRKIMKHNFIPAILIMAGGVCYYIKMQCFFHTCNVPYVRWGSVPTLFVYYRLPNNCCQRTITDGKIDSNQSCLVYYG